MSTTAIEAVLSKAMSDAAFADQLFANPDQALTGFELTTEEINAFKNFPRANFDKYLQATPEDRKSFGIGLVLQHNQTSLSIHS